MNFDLKRPCSNCPFRKVGAIELHVDRLPSIIASLLADDHEWFMCHKTIAQARRGRSQCVGSMVYLLKAGAPSVSMRVAAAVGVLKFDELRAQADTIINPQSE
ncbi:MAG TPA: hypothetical protein VJO99_07100 [Burkholderiaceae bacterium]|nr:hypothetical protein [Burkholderiaceae bacterium]